MSRLKNFGIIISQTLVSIPFRIVYILFTVFKVKGLENLRHTGKNGKGVIFVANHNSQIDSTIIPSALPILSRFLPTYFVSLKKEFYTRFKFRSFYGGRVFSMLGAIPVDKYKKDYSEALKEHAKLLNMGRSILIFPEGRVVPGYGLAEARGGAGYLAEVTGADIVPVCITGDEDLTPRDFFSFRRKFIIRFGEITSFSKLFSPEMNAENKYKAVASACMSRVARMLDEERPGELVTSPVISPLRVPMRV